jgi:hypothetical protein
VRFWALVGLLFASAWAAVPVAPAGASVLSPVKRPLGDGAVIDWTHLVLEVTAVGFDPLLKSDSKPLEQQAITKVDARISEVVSLVPVSPEETLGSVNPRAAQDAMAAWRVSESRYFDAGPVQVVGSLEIQPLAAGWQWQRAERSPEEVPGTTGIVIDARGKGVEPVLAPRVVDDAQALIYDGKLWKDVAYQRSPVVWVSDPAHPQAQAAGVQPMFLVAKGGGAGWIQLDADGAARLRAVAASGRVLGDGALVIVVEP